jgi:UDP-N-acetylglucosamine 2-epimerase (non-hydrolysing)
VDDPAWLRDLIETLAELSTDLNVVFPVHPRTRQRLEALGAQKQISGRLQLLDPLPYLHFLALQRYASVVITDSGGIQEETTFLGVPCLTVRENTERPITVTRGTNQLVGRDLRRLQTAVREVLAKKDASEPQRKTIPLWDGHAAQRIAKVILS